MQAKLCVFVCCVGWVCMICMYIHSCVSVVHGSFVCEFVSLEVRGRSQFIASTMWVPRIGLRAKSLRKSHLLGSGDGRLSCSA